MPSRIFFGNPGVAARNIALSPVVVDVVRPAMGVDVPREVTLSPVIVHATIPAVTVVNGIVIALSPVIVHATLPAVTVVNARYIALSPVVVDAVRPAMGVDVPRTFNLSPVIVHATIPAVGVAVPVSFAIALSPVIVYAGISALANDVPTLPGVGPVTKGYIEDKPQITYDGSGLVNRIIPFGVDSDGSDLTLEHAFPSQYHYHIKNEGSTWYIEDSASIALYGLYEQKVYRTDVKNPYLKQSTGALVLGANPTAGDAFTIGDDTYTYTATPTSPLDVGLGATLPATRMNTYAALVASDGLNSPPSAVEVATIDPDAIAAPTVDEFGNWTSLPPWAGMTAGDPSAIPLTAIDPGPIPIVTTSTFASSSNGFATAEMNAGAYAQETANVLYALAVNDLIKRRAEVLIIRVAVANGADIWALPGDRVQFTFNGVAETLEAESLGGSGRVTWLTIDRPMLVVERHDKSDASGVRRVEFVLACPMIEYSVPALPEWTDPVALPVPGETGIGNEGPGADWLGDALGDILTGNKLPVPTCCPDPTTDTTRGTNLLPPPIRGSAPAAPTATIYGGAPELVHYLDAAGLVYTADPANEVFFVDGHWGPQWHVYSDPSAPEVVGRYYIIRWDGDGTWHIEGGNPTWRGTLAGEPWSGYWYNASDEPNTYLAGWAWESGG